MPTPFTAASFINCCKSHRFSRLHQHLPEVNSSYAFLPFSALPEIRIGRMNAHSLHRRFLHQPDDQEK
ncbi:hypothetical protein Mapa_002201 [Marchantia paleacea]|nr:hypothetical protein Mapa_002201 [Marchantia paleacea]